jgi:hypothetical protein
MAAMNGHYDMVALLIAQGSNVNAMDQVRPVRTPSVDFYQINSERLDMFTLCYKSRPFECVTIVYALECRSEGGNEG